MNAAEQRATASPVLLTVEDAARAMAVGRTTVYQLVAAGSLRSVKIGRSRRIPLDAIREYVAGISTEHGGVRP